MAYLFVFLVMVMLSFVMQMFFFLVVSFTHSQSFPPGRRVG